MTEEEFKAIIARAIQHYHDRRATGAKPIASHEDKSKSHPQWLCERCLELKRLGDEQQSCMG